MCFGLLFNSERLQFNSERIVSKLQFFAKFLRCLLNKKDRCIELYYESNEYNITYCHGEIYKILGEIPNEILEAQQLFYDIGESSDYESLIAYLETKKKKQGCAKCPQDVQITLGVFTF